MSECNKTVVEVAISIIQMRIHTKEKSFQWKFFDKKYNLKTHMSECDKTMVKGAISTIHMRIHTKKKSFQWTFFDKKFTQMLPYHTCRNSSK